MGNSASNASNSPSRAIRGVSPSPSPGHPHPSLRTKKKSLELPDLASLSLAQNNNPRGRQAKTASIPIPTIPLSPFNHYQQPQQTQRAPRHLPSTADVNNLVVPPQNHLPFPPAPRPDPSVPGGRQPTFPRQQVARMQELYNQSQHPANTPSRQSPFQQETVRSSIPVALSKALPNEPPQADEIVQQEYPQKEDLLAEFVPVNIVWKGGGTQVVLARAGDDEWKGRQLMEKESANVWTLTVMLRPGTHHVRFLVDGQWRVADDIPAAVDDQGSLANYVAVPIPALAPAPAPLPPVTRDKLIPGQSFWSADSSVDGESEHHNHIQQPHQKPQPQQHISHSHSQSTNWTNVLPPELIEAAREEEAYLSASAGQYEVSSSNTRVTTGFVPAPNIPPAPGLPRHLEKLILNTRMGAGASGATGTASSGAAGGGVGLRSGSRQAMGGVGSMGVGSGQGQAARKREGDKKERDRDRVRRRATTAAAAAAVNTPPPPPPPSEDGAPSSWVLPSAQMVGTTSLPEAFLTGEPSLGGTINASSTTTPGSASAQPPTISTNTTPPQTASPSTLITAMSPVQDKTYGGGGSENANGTGIGHETSPTMSPTKSPTTPHSASAPNSATTSANTSATASPNPNVLLNTSPTPTLTPIPTSTSTTTPPSITPSTSTTYPHLTPSGSRTITIDSTMPSLSDDGSVLPVPSHVVLHHLSTSAIRNGVLAVGNTIRYRKKYLTTIYYKPT